MALALRYVALHTNQLLYFYREQCLMVQDGECRWDVFHIRFHDQLRAQQ